MIGSGRRGLRTGINCSLRRVAVPTMAPGAGDQLHHLMRRDQRSIPVPRGSSSGRFGMRGVKLSPADDLEPWGPSTAGIPLMVNWAL